MRRDTRSPSATRIAITLGAIVAVVMLGVWGVAAVAGNINGGLEPGPETPVASKPATTVSEPTETASAVATLPPAKPEPKPLPPAKGVPTKSTPVVVKPAAASGKYTVVIDPGHGGELSGTEAMGPWKGAPQKPKTNYGADGEAQVVLQVALKLRPLLEAQGVKVVMIRTAPAAISNKERAMRANATPHADLFLRLHCDGVDNSSIHGISMQVPGDSRGWAPIAESRKAGELIQSALIRETGAANRGIVARTGNDGGLVGFNWSKIPTALPEMGFLSNPSERAKLKSAGYQAELAKAIADGTMAYLHTVR